MAIQYGSDALDDVFTTASGGNDTFYGGDNGGTGGGNDTFSLGGVNDIFYGGIGNDTVNSLNGNDTLSAGNGNDLLYGEDGNDSLNGGNNDDVAWGGIGNDSIAGGNENDTLFGGEGIDVLNAGNNNDTLFGGDGVDTLYGGGSDDTLFGGAAASGFANTIFGGALTDTVSYVDETVTVYADLGTGGGHVGGVLLDTMSLIENLVGGSGNDVLVGDGLANSLAGGARTDLLFGGNGDDTLVGGTAASGEYNQLFGGAGNDTAGYAAETTAVTASLAGYYAYVGGIAPADLRDIYNSIENLTGGSGNDSLEGDGLANTLTGGTGSDLLFGGDGDDLLFGGTISTGIANQLWGGNGIDTANYLGETARVTADLDGLYGYVGGIAPADLRDLFNAIENLTGGTGNDLLAGNAAVNVIDGGAGSGNDTLWGRGGNDALTGGDGNDWLLGNDGIDTLTAGTGADRVYWFGSETGGADIVTDFASAQGDKFYLLSGGFGSYAAAQTIDLFTGTGTSDAIFAAHVAQGFAYDTATGALYFDADGSAGGFAATQIATLSNLATLLASDFVVI